MKRKDPNIKDLHIMCSAEQHREAKLKAVENNLTISEYALKAILNGKIEARLSNEELLLLRSLQGISTNVNQIARKLNQLDTSKITIALAEDAIQKINSLLINIDSKPIENEN